MSEGTPDPAELPALPAAEQGGPRHAIRRVRLAHCARGPALCKQCRDEAEERICLLALFPPDAGASQRRLLEVEIEGIRQWWAFDILRAFSGVDEARAYATLHGVEPVEL